MLSSRKQDALEAAAAEIGGDVAVFAANAGEPDQAEACVQATVERFGAVDILVNNAATNPYMGPVMEIDAPRYDKTMQVNLRGPVFWSQAAWRASMRDGGGVVLNMASVGGFVRRALSRDLQRDQGGLMHLTRTLAAELAPGVRVNAIAPGPGQDRPRPGLVGARGRRRSRRRRPRAGSARSTTSPTRRCSSSATWRRGSPERRWSSTAAPWSVPPLSERRYGSVA